jgi:hypothetical protein
MKLIRFSLIFLIGSILVACSAPGGGPTGPGKITLQFSNTNSARSIAKSSSQAMVSSNSRSIARSMTDPDGSGQLLVNDDFIAAYQWLEYKGYRPDGYITPTQFEVFTYGMDLYNFDNTNNVLFGAVEGGFGNSGTPIDFAGTPPSISATINADTYVCFSLDLNTSSGNISGGGISNPITLDTLTDNFIQLLKQSGFKADLLGGTDKSQKDYDTLYSNLRNGLKNLAWGNTHPLSWKTAGQSLLTGSNTNLPIVIDPSGNYTITLSWLLGDNGSTGGIIAHYNVDGKNYYTLRRDFMDRMEVSSTEDSSTSNQ